MEGRGARRDASLRLVRLHERGQRARLRQIRAKTTIVRVKIKKLRTELIGRHEAERQLRAVTAQILLELRGLCASADPLERRVGEIALRELGDIQTGALRATGLVEPDADQTPE